MCRLWLRSLVDDELEHVPIELTQQLAHLPASRAGLSRGSRFTAKIIGMAGTSPAMTLHVWFDLTETRSSYRFSPEKGRKPLVSAAVVMNAESGSVKTVRVGRVVSGVSGSPALARVVASGRLALKISAGRVGAVDSLDGALDCGPQSGDFDPAGWVAIKLARARAGGKRAQECHPLADLARPNRDGQSIKFGTGKRHRGRFLLLAFDGSRIDHHRVRLVALPRGLDGILYGRNVEKSRPHRNNHHRGDADRFLHHDPCC